MYQLILCRHGQSEWNKENRFTGWWDVSLSEKGIEEAIEAAKKIKRAGLSFDLAYTSLLSRAIKTLFFIQEYNNLLWTPVYKSWHLNERHYGGLTGLNKKETAQKYGEDQVKIWRRSYDVPPPCMNKDNLYFVGNDPRYSDVPSSELPETECLKDTLKRVAPYWEKEIVPKLKGKKKIIIVAHGNSLRSLMKLIGNISDEEIVSLEIPTGSPLIYQLDKDFKGIDYSYL